MSIMTTSKKLIDFAQGLQQSYGEGRLRLSVIFSNEPERQNDMDVITNETPNFTVLKADNKSPVKFLKGVVGVAVSKDQGVLIDYRGFVSADLKMLLDDLSAGRLDLGNDQILSTLPDSAIVLIIDDKYFEGSGLMRYFSSYCRP